MEQAEHRLLPELPGLRIPAELGPTALPGGKVDEVLYVPAFRCMGFKFFYPNSINIFVWAIALSTHAACKNFAGLMVVRIILGICEGYDFYLFTLSIVGLSSFRSSITAG
jgi:hypothetical protein